MRIDLLSLFPDMFAGVLDQSIIKRARDKGLVEIVLTDIRDYASDNHRSVDDNPYGGGSGMVMMCGPVFDAVEDVRRTGEPVDEIILLTPQGRRFDQPLARKLAGKQRLILIAGRYEGFDERIRRHLATMEISIGDYVLSGGEIPAMVVADAVIRLIPGVLGDDYSQVEESFSQNLLEYPQYTRPADFRGWSVPEILLSGNHAEIKKWRQEQAINRTRQRRPDLLDKQDIL
ncbi:MAG: tRNA (guanosine(37)-N1)-methyltransferase TrmD [Sedimentisphaerales bacterium]|nr:tRNA (guanosine(37)-N1)-methyltransferase TrmD [Sedimentisphaerales bacterium]